jgi:hypothetical protein
MSENVDFDLRYYQLACAGCQFVNKGSDGKCPYYISPRLVDMKKGCYFRTYCSLKSLKQAQQIIKKKNKYYTFLKKVVENYEEQKTEKDGINNEQQNISSM